MRDMGVRNMEVELGEVGRRVESPNLGQPWGEIWWRESHTYKVSLIMEPVVERMEAGDTLVVEVEVDSGEGQTLVGRGRPIKSYNLPDKEYVLHEQRESWDKAEETCACLLYTSPSPRDLSTSRMPSSA